MALIPEDGTGLSNADTYASEAELAAYAAARGITVTGTDTQLLIQAMDYLESKSFIGDKYSSTQALQWPRNNVMIDEYSIPYSTIPQLLKDAQIEIALSIDGGTNPMTNIDRETKREKVGDIEVEYMDGAMNSSYLTAAETKLNKLVKIKTGSYRV
jgi:hypothetical protein